MNELQGVRVAMGLEEIQVWWCCCRVVGAPEFNTGHARDELRPGAVVGTGGEESEAG